MTKKERGRPKKEGAKKPTRKKKENKKKNEYHHTLGSRMITGDAAVSRPGESGWVDPSDQRSTGSLFVLSWIRVADLVLLICFLVAELV